MRLLRKIFYGVCILIVLCCGAVMICAFNPSLTESILATFQDEGELKSGEVVIELLPTDTVVSAGIESEMVGYEPVSSKEEEIDAESATELKKSLETGPMGEDLTFDEQLYPYYGMLEGEERALYRQIYANAMERNQSFRPAMIFKYSGIKDVFEAVYNDHPELFWLETEYSCKYLEDGQCLEITLKYNETVENFDEAKQRFEARAKEIIKKTEQFSQLDVKEQMVHDELIETVKYNKNAEMGQSAYSALVNGESVCAGYARAFQYIMQQIGVPCYYCTGTSDGDHAWNIIKLGGKYYNVDVTWDDTTTPSYNYYNKTDKEYAATHTRTGMSVKLPACVEYASDDAAYAEAEKNKPLEWPLLPFDSEEAEEELARREKEANLEKAGVTEEEVLETMDAYYKDCLAQMKKQGSGLKTFTNVIPKDLWQKVEQAYSQNKHRSGYVDKALKALKMENFAIQLQVEDLSGGYYKLHHNVSTW